MGIGESVYSAMKNNTFGYPWGIVQISFTLYSVGNKITDDYFFVFTGKIDMGQKVHSINICIFELLKLKIGQVTEFRSITVFSGFHSLAFPSAPTIPQPGASIF